MVEQLSGADYWLPVAFISIMGLAVLVYAVLDGFDLGVGILLPMNSDAEIQRDVLISSIGPFWDANETWLVLAIGVLLIAFPSAHSLVLKELYIPAVILLGGLILRGVAFDFRAKAFTRQKKTWDASFKAGSIIASMAQGYMLGMYVMGFDESWGARFFALVSAFCVTAAYAFIGGAWLVMKTEGDIQIRSARWARRAGWVAAFGIVLVSMINPFVNIGVYEKWFGFPQVTFLMIVPLLCAGLFYLSDRHLKNVPHKNDYRCWLPFNCAIGIFVLCFAALGYSYFPYIVPGQVDVWEAASATESLMFIFIGAVIVVPAIIGYTILSYKIFSGKTTELRYY